MAVGASADLTSSKSKFANSAKWLAGLAKSGKYQGKTYGVPYYAGSRVITYRADLFKKAGVTKAPTSLAKLQAALVKVGKMQKKVKGFSPCTSAARTGTAPSASCSTTAARSPGRTAASGSGRSTRGSPSPA